MIKFFFNFKSSITSLILICITYYYLSKKKTEFLMQTSHIYILSIFVIFFLVVYLGYSNLYCRLVIFAFWYLLSILYV